MDYTKECWYCRGQTMQPQGSYYQCAKCGATWNTQPVLGPAPRTIEANPATGGTKYKPHGGLFPTRKARKGGGKR